MTHEQPNGVPQDKTDLDQKSILTEKAGRRRRQTVPNHLLGVLSLGQRGGRVSERQPAGLAGGPRKGIVISQPFKVVDPRTPSP